MTISSFRGFSSLRNAHVVEVDPSSHLENEWVKKGEFERSGCLAYSCFAAGLFLRDWRCFHLAGLSALYELGHCLLLLLRHLGLAHADLHRDRPLVAVRVGELSVSFAPEHVVDRHGNFGACVNCLMPELVDVLAVEVDCNGAVA